MRVLMFGWEFPPHISGGLGTACQGLTNSLSQEDVDVLFVVPKLHGEETSARTEFINASNVPIHKHHTLDEHISLLTAKDPSVRETLYKVIRNDQSRIETIEVNSSLSPYRSPAFESQSTTVEHWNYSLPTEIEDDDNEIVEYDSSHITESINRHTVSKEVLLKPYAFSGSYGPNLIEEVKRYAQVAAEIASEHKFDVIHAHDWMTYLAGIAAKKISGKPLVVHVHATEFDRSGEFVDKQVHAIECEGMTAADCVVTVSQWTKNIAINKYHIPEEKIEVVHNGIIPKDFGLKQFALPPIGSNVVTFLGRITHQKGPLYFVEAARNVLNEIPDAHFVVAGSGDLLPLMIERIAQLRMSSNFHFTGFLKGQDIDKVWSMSSVYVMPSVSEPFGIAPLEAIQAGVPVIISKQSGVSEVMPHAIKVDFWNTKSLGAAICSVLKYKSLHKTLAQNGVDEIQDITWTNAAKKLTKLYHELTIN